MEKIIIPVLVLSIMGGIFAFLLGIVSKLTFIPVDEKEQAVREALPGANCGACGYPGCDGCAKAISEGNAPTNACVIGGAKVTEVVSAILGVKAELLERTTAYVKCGGTKDKTFDKFHYEGIDDCRVMTESYGGCKSCSYGCLGCGTCKKHCEYDAISMIDGIAVINPDKCVSCGCCVKVCPKKIIEIIPYGMPSRVQCSNRDFGKVVKDNCEVGCIGCSMCTRIAPENFRMDGKLAVSINTDTYDLEKLLEAEKKCPGKCIHVHNI